MNKPQKESQRLASWLADAIMTEMAKPEEEIDVEFVESCENLLNTIMGEKKLTDEEIEVRVNKIMESRANPRVVPKKRKTAFIAIIAAVVFLISGITVCATTPISQYILKALDLGLNQSVEENKITFINNGENTIYRTLEELLDSENINICYPEKYAYNIELSKIFITEKKDQVIFYFNDPRIAFEINYDVQLKQNLLYSEEVLNFKNHSFYIHYIDSTVVAYAVINNAFYNLKCDSKDELFKMIYSLNFERLE